MTRLKQEKEVLETDSNRIYVLVDEIVLPHFDFEKMSRWVLGKHWRKASAEEKSQFVNEFRTLLVRTYSRALMDNVDQQIDYLPLRADENATDVTVNTEIPQESGFPIPISYSMYLKDGAWKVYDVNIDGLSLVGNYRTSFANEIRQGSIAELIKTLSERNSQARNE